MKKQVVCLFFIFWATSVFAADPNQIIPKDDNSSKVTTYESFDSMFTLYQPYISNISAYQPIYFLMGADPENSRFQISLKYQLFSKECPLVLCKPWLSGLHLGYTQTSSWDLESNSAPFEDTSYKPEVFFISKNTFFLKGFFEGVFYQAGALHESNGQKEDQSRSTNYFYFKPIAIMYNENSGLGLQVSPKFIVFFNNSDNSNPGIDKYRGQVELQLKAGKTDGLVFDSNIRFAQEGTSVQLDLTYPLSLSFFTNLSLYVHAQYVDALAETLLNYQERTETFRLGIALVR